jgi:hypothetical protein
MFRVRHSASGIPPPASGVPRRRSASGVPRPAFRVRRSASGVLRPAFRVRRSASGALRSRRSSASQLATACNDARLLVALWLEPESAHNVHARGGLWMPTAPRTTTRSPRRRARPGGGCPPRLEQLHSTPRDCQGSCSPPPQALPLSGVCLFDRDASAASRAAGILMLLVPAGVLACIVRRFHVGVGRPVPNEIYSADWLQAKMSEWSDKRQSWTAS